MLFFSSASYTAISIAFIPVLLVSIVTELVAALMALFKWLIFTNWLDVTVANANVDLWIDIAKGVFSAFSLIW